MKMKEIEELVALVKKEGLSELKYEDDNVKIKIGMPTGGVVVPAPVVQAPISTNMGAPRAPSKNEGSGENTHKIKSPFVGTFYSSPSPDRPPFIKVGDRVSKGQTLCILEAMKIMNEIESDINGEVVSINVENESLVEFGQVLFEIKV